MTVWTGPAVMFFRLGDAETRSPGQNHDTGARPTCHHPSEGKSMTLEHVLTVIKNPHRSSTQSASGWLARQIALKEEGIGLLAMPDD